MYIKMNVFISRCIFQYNVVVFIYIYIFFFTLKEKTVFSLYTFQLKPFLVCEIGPGPFSPGGRRVSPISLFLFFFLSFFHL